MRYLWLCLPGLALQLTFIFVERRKNYAAAVALKGCASLVFILLGYLGMGLAQDQGFARLVFAGLVLGGVALAAALLWWIFSRVREVKPAFKAFGIVYIGAVVLMTAVAGGNLLTGGGTTNALLYFIGALLFTVSDVILIFNTFGGSARFSLRAANLGLYYFGQPLIALSLQFI